MYSVRGNETGVNGLAAEQKALVPSMLLVFIFVFVVLGWDFFFILKLLLLHVFLLMYIWSLSSLAFLGFICFVCVSVCTKSMSFLILQLMRPSHILLSGQGCK